MVPIESVLQHPRSATSVIITPFTLSKSGNTCNSCFWLLAGRTLILLLAWTWTCILQQKQQSERCTPMPKKCNQRDTHSFLCVWNFALIRFLQILGPLFTSPRSPFGPLFAQNWVPFLQYLGPLEIVEQCGRARISGHLGKIARITSRFLWFWFCPDWLSENEKIMLKSVETVTYTLKFRQFSPQFETFLPLKSLFMSILCCQKSFKLYKICSKIFEHGFGPPSPLLNNVEKNRQIVGVGFPKGQILKRLRTSNPNCCAENPQTWTN